MVRTKLTFEFHSIRLCNQVPNYRNHDELANIISKQIHLMSSNAMMKAGPLADRRLRTIFPNAKYPICLPTQHPTLSTSTVHQKDLADLREAIKHTGDIIQDVLSLLAFPNRMQAFITNRRESEY